MSCQCCRGIESVCTVTPKVTVGLPWQTHIYMHLCMKHTGAHTRIHVFSMKQTGRSIMVSGRNGVRFPKGPAAPWWAMGLEVGPRSVCVYLHMGMPE